MMIVSGKGGKSRKAHCTTQIADSEIHERAGGFGLRIYNLKYKKSAIEHGRRALGRAPHLP